MAHMAAGAPLIPEIYLRMARLYLERGDLDGARRAAMSLVRATPETSYVLGEGRRILEAVESERSVNKTAVGCLLPLSGPFAIYGQEVLNGMALGMGLFSDPPPSVGLELLIRDTQGEPEKTVAALGGVGQPGKGHRRGRAPGQQERCRRCEPGPGAGGPFDHNDAEGIDHA